MYHTVSGRARKPPTAAGDHRDLDVGHIGARRPAEEQISERREKSVGVVVGERCPWVQPAGPGPLQRGAVDEGACRIGWSVDPVGARAQYEDIFAGKLIDQGERKLLVATAAA